MCMDELVVGNNVLPSENIQAVIVWQEASRNCWLGRVLSPNLTEVGEAEREIGMDFRKYQQCNCFQMFEGN